MNTDAKLFLLTHAFESLCAHRVKLKTDVLNERSRNAIIRLGAVQEGIFRRHAITDSGRVRDSVIAAFFVSSPLRVRDFRDVSTGSNTHTTGTGEAAIVP